MVLDDRAPRELVTSDTALPRGPHHGPGGGFMNPWPGELPRPFGALLRWWWQRRVQGVRPDPDRSVFQQVAPTFRAPRAPAEILTVTWVGHSTTLLQVGGRNVLTDPMFGERASPVRWTGPRRWVAPGVALDALPPIDAVLVSHNHYDHLDLGTVRYLGQRFPEARWHAPLGLTPILRGSGVAHVREHDWWDHAAVDGLSITATPARHFSARGPMDRNRSLWCGFAVASERHRVFFAGDTGYHSDFARIGERCGPFDLALLPIGAYDPQWFMHVVHVTPEEAVRAFVELGGSVGGVMGAIHWGTFKLTDEPMDEPPTRATAAWATAGLSPERLWVPKHGETLEISSRPSSRGAFVPATATT